MNGVPAEVNENPAEVETLLCKLRSLVQHTKPAFISVAGDNYYPFKTKTISVEKLKKGFELLKRVSPTVPVFRSKYNK
jgi:hypothetical protein